MKTFIIEVPEGKTGCEFCPFYRNNNICKYLSISKQCDEYDFQSAHMLGEDQINKSMLELENTEFDYGHNVNYESNE